MDRPNLTQRALATAIGGAGLVGGVWAVFATDNELGTAALLIVGGFFLLAGVLGLVPTRFRVGENEVTVGRAALTTLERIVHESDAPTRESALETFEDELAARGVTRSPDEAVSSMLDRFVRYSGSDAARQVHDALADDGWVASTPPKSAYIRWSYEGRRGPASLFQNSAQLVVASNRLVDLVRGLPGAEHRLPKNEVVFNYGRDLPGALEAAAIVRRFVDGN